MLLFADLHLRPESEATCFEVLSRVSSLVEEFGEREVGFLGDWWHVRYAIPVVLLNRVAALLRSWVARGLQVHVLPGNHDQVDVAGMHALEVFQDIPGVLVYSGPTHDPRTGTWLPYRKDPRVLLDWLRARPAEERSLPVFMHHGIAGAYMNDNVLATGKDGIDPAAFASYPVVFCGHWHRHHTVGNCVYVGSPWQTTASEAGQVKGVVRWGGKAWSFHEVEVGRRYHRVRDFTREEIAGVRRGDLVRVSSDLGPKQLEGLVAALQKVGADVQVEPAEKSYAGSRLGLDSGAPVRAMAETYARAQVLPEGVDVAYLMQLYDEVVAP